jgi:precorrin-6B methylase 2/acyl carrier protein
VCETLEVDPEELDANRDFAAYGLDSVMVLDINNALEADFPNLPQTLFFEHATLNALADWFLVHEGDTLGRLAGTAAPGPRASVATPDEPQAEPVEPAPAGVPRAAAPGAFDLDGMIERLETATMDEHLRHTPFQSVAPMADRNPGFSFARCLVAPEDCGGDLRAIAAAQAEMRRVMLAGTDLSGVRHALDLGCGIGADLVELAESCPGLMADGFTVSSEDARIVRDLTREHGVADRVRVIEADNRTHELDRAYDLVLSIQTAHFAGGAGSLSDLLGRVADALTDGGHLVMADYVCTLAEPMQDAALGASVSTVEQWATAAAHAGLAVTEAIDLSAEVANFLHEPQLDDVLAGLDAGTADMVRKLARQGDSLEKGWVRFCILHLRHAGGAANLTEANATALNAPVAYPEVRARASDTPAYQDVLARFPEFLGGTEYVK